ncbi:uncharacterized protein DUF4296 [Tenacibaculum skagerrakense]|uniref:Uncharacterized protein DUF4296 n=1 Tax=Tenacibaculum skagerrakense TaxID=186571 RepID=A0A4R2NQ87_9FLAO|nr:DUF4296 domain-containing protein [Tenacibaculum skagerrakense]TCP23960.1 uncharacterized protein DUF4296 [Tenacibaculum skagerrakense]
MKRLQFIIASLILFVSCTGNTIYKKPKDLIPRDSMVLLLTDMHIAAAARQTKNKFNGKDVNYMYLIYEKYKIDSTRFENSNTYYTSMIDNYDKLLNEVKEHLQQKGVDIQKEINASDSITKDKKKEVKLEIDSLITDVEKKRTKKLQQTTKEEE